MSNNTHPSFMRKILFFLKFLEIRLRFVFILLITALVVGYWDNVQNHWERWQRRHMEQGAHEEHKAAANTLEYYCPMHPFVIRERPGKCPICGMDLSQRKKGEKQELPAGTLARVQVSPDRIMQAGVQVEPALYRLLTNSVRSYGVIEAAESRVARIAARFPGRVDDLKVNSVGLMVKKGEPLARIYSSKYLAATQEYAQALEAQKRTESDAQATTEEKGRAADLTKFARQRLALAGFTDEQLNTIAAQGKQDDHVTLYSPLSGIVLEKKVLLGDVVEEGTTLYTISDLSVLWVQALVFERDIDNVKMGTPVEVTSVAHPGQIFYGTVDFISPTIDAQNRSGRVRVVVDNKDGQLKPGMYVTTVIRSAVGTTEQLDGSGADAAKMDMTKQSAVRASAPAKEPKPVKLPTLTQKDADQFLTSLKPGDTYYQCPMHPEVVSNQKGDCPKCGMHLEETKVEQTADQNAEHTGNHAPGAPEPSAPAEAATEQWAEGFACPMHLDRLVSEGGICRIDNCGMQMKKWRVQRVLSVPESAIIDTGTRYVIYVETQPGVYDAREVKLGTRSGAYYPVLSGLQSGQRIVTRGSFLIDAEARLNPAVSGSSKAQETAPAHQHGRKS